MLPNRNAIFGCAVLATSLTAPGFAYAGNLEIAVSAIRSNKGSILLALHNSKSTFPNGKQPFRVVEMKAASGTVIISIADVPPGTYAFSLYHDENANKKLDTNFVGLPKEGYAFSRNARGKFGAPKFEDAAFKIGPNGGAATVSIGY